MVTWSEFTATAPRISDVFQRRHAATNNLCMLGTIRGDGYPRISPMEPIIFESQLVLVGMTGTTKFRDLERDPRLCLHTATVDTQLGDGDAKVWAEAHNLQDEGFHQRFAEDLLEKSGMDLRNERFDPFFVADITGASSIELEGNELVITIWRPGESEQVVRKQ